MIKKDKDLQDGTERIRTQLVSVKESLSAGPEHANNVLVVLELEVVPLGRVWFFMFFVIPPLGLVAGPLPFFIPKLVKTSADKSWLLHEDSDCRGEVACQLDEAQVVLARA
jgi:hypothetical protein